MGITNHSGITLLNDGLPSGGTNGQVLTKVGSIDYEASWQNGGAGSSPLTTKGDLYGYDTSNARIPVGANGTVLTADSTQALGVKWGTVSGTGDVVGPASATDNAIARFDGITGKLIQNSAATIADTSGDITAGTYNGNTIGAGS